MNFSIKTKDKILKVLLESELNTNYKIKNISDITSIKLVNSEKELIHYLHILSWEQLIDIEIENDKILSIFILPNAFSRYAAIKNESYYRNISLFLALVSAICTLIQICNLI